MNGLSNRQRGIRLFLGLIHLVAAQVVCGQPTSTDKHMSVVLPGVERLLAAPPGDHLGGVAAATLVNELSCTACHHSTRPELTPKRGPILDGIRARVQSEWIRRFLKSPHQTKPGTTMPDLLVGRTDRDRVVEALTQFLLQGSRAPSQFVVPLAKSQVLHPDFAVLGDAERGKVLFHQVGCVACHAADRAYQTSVETVSDAEKKLREAGLSEDEVKEELEKQYSSVVSNVPYPKLSAKYSHESLTHFLFDPLRIRPTGRMPKMKLSAEESADIGAYLLIDKRTREPIPPVVVDRELAAKGRMHFQSLGCIHCHDMPKQGGGTPVPANDVAPKAVAWKEIASKVRKADLQRGCLNPSSSSGVPRFALNKNQQSLLRKVLIEGDSKKSKADSVTHTLARHNCYACHQRRLVGGVTLAKWQFFETRNHVDLGDEGRIPPALDGVGSKLQSSWVARVLAGNGDVRPHMLARMPQFGNANVGHLVRAFEAADLLKKKPAVRIGKPSSETVNAARNLLGKGCVKCHSINGQSLPGVVGVDLTNLQQRLRGDWFQRLIRNPGQVKKRTRMPSFFANGKSTVVDVLDGNADAQVDALWQYLATSSKHALPDALAKDRIHNFELKPKKHPQILRTFMQYAGTHAIATGTPQGVHFAFDASTCEMKVAWKGRFLDAHGTWFDRFTPLAKPLGHSLLQFPQLLNANRKAEFGGFKLVDGIPEFRYRTGQVEIRDYSQPRDDGLRRVIRLRSLNGQSVRLPLRLAKSVKPLKQLGSALVYDAPSEDGKMVRVTVSLGKTDNEPRVVREGKAYQWILPLNVQKGSQAVVIHYQWGNGSANPPKRK